MSSGAEQHARFMAAALRLGRQGLGLTAPNPSVGALIVRHEDGAAHIVGKGFTQAGGRPHAEVVALRQAGDLARGATLYASLEPCAHIGKSPPCAEAIIAAGIAHVVSAMEDPNPHVRGKGHQALRHAGIEVTQGVLESEARWTGLGHVNLTTLNRPFVQLKLAHSADGMIAGPGNAPVSITGDIVAGWSHRWRAQADAILIGVSTVLADDPQLTCRLPGAEARSPVRVVLDSHLRTPSSSRLIQSAGQVPVWIASSEAVSQDRADDLAAAGAEIIKCPIGPNGRIATNAVLARLAARGITRLFVEGGARVAGTFVREHLCDEAILLCGRNRIGKGGISAFGAQTGIYEDQVNGLAFYKEQMIGDDRMRVFRRSV